jgi:outer membrane protein
LIFHFGETLVLNLALRCLQRLHLILILMPMTASAQDVTIVKFLETAWSSSPVIKGEALQNEASNQLVSAVRGKYLPRLSLDAIDSTGFPASNSALQVGGLMGSPFRSGLAGGVVLQQTVYDFGRIQSLLEHAKAERSLVRARLSEDKFRFLLSLGQLYLECAHARSLQLSDVELMGWAKINLKETARFTKTGQRSVIDNSLVQTEVNGLQLELDQLHRYEQSLSEQMKLYGASAGCKGLGDSWQVHIPDDLRVEAPSLLIAKAQIELAQASYHEAKAAQLPTLNVMGSVGDMEKTRLVDKENYAAGSGLVFPIWNGEDSRREEAYKAQADYQSENLKAAQLEYTARIKNLEDEYLRDRDALTVIEGDLQQVQKTIKLASKRYQSLEGPLIDVREAFKQLRQMGLERLRVMTALGEVSLQLGMLGQNK